MATRATTVMVLLALSVLAAGGCARSKSLTVEGGPPGPESPPDRSEVPERTPRPPINWETPYRAGIMVASPSEAETHVDFHVRAPAFGRDPERIQVSDPDQVARQERSVAMVFSLPRFGQVVVKQQLPHLTLDDLRRRADSPDAPADAFRMVSVRGTEGLLVSWEGVGRLTWIEGGVLFDILGRTISPDQVQELAAQI